MTIQNEITIVVSRDKVRALAKDGAAGYGLVHMDQLRLATIKVFEELLLSDTIQSRRHMEVLGQHLYAGVINNEPNLPGVDQLLNNMLNEVKKDRLRLQLQFDRDVDPEIASSPWEFLYSPSRQDFLATDVNLVLCRYLELGKNREKFSASERPLRALVAVSRPQDERTILAKDVISAIENLNTPQEECVRLTVLEQPTLKTIEDALRMHQPHIFHFIGHGRYDQIQKSGSLLLVNADTNNSESCDEATLIDCFKRAQCFPRLVFLHMCEGGIIEKDATALQAFSGFAPKLIHAKIASVVAMQYPIKNLDARDFSVAFYSTLADGGSVDEAVQEGRSRLDVYRRSRLFGTPVLYMHSAGGLVIPRQQLTPSLSPSITDADEGIKEPGRQPAVDKTTNIEPPIDQAVLDKIINTGISAAAAITDTKSRMAVTQRLLRMKKGLVGKARTDIFSVFFTEWENETEETIKAALETILPEI